MHNTSARVVLVQARVRQLRRRREKRVIGTLTAASAGVTAAVVFSFIMSLLFHSKTKRN